MEKKKEKEKSQSNKISIVLKNIPGRHTPARIVVPFDEQIPRISISTAYPPKDLTLKRFSTLPNGYGGGSDRTLF